MEKMLQVLLEILLTIFKFWVQREDAILQKSCFSPLKTLFESLVPKFHCIQNK